jgi:alkylation response protein AidB-like acyl-CoA dehydrogenase
MDFALSDEQTAVVDLARQILTDRSTLEHLKEVESGVEWFDRSTWNELAKADLLGLVLPEAVGGGGFGYLEVALLLNEVGRAVSPIPLWSTLTGALAIAELGDEAQAQRWLPGVVSGDTILALGIAEIDGDLRDPQTTATPEGDGWRLDGAKTSVSAFHVADAILVTAATPDGARLFVVPTDAAGVRGERQDTFNHEPQSHVALEGVSVGADALVGADAARAAAAVGWLADRAVIGWCAMAAGVAEVGMRITAGYVTQRKQFDKPLGTFQAVCHRMADCFVDAAAINLTMLQAATQLAELSPTEEIDPKLVAVAKYWASYSGSRVGHAGLHLHGGISIDLDYSIHRYFLWSKHLELQLGASRPQLARIGRLLAEEPVPAA